MTVSCSTASLVIVTSLSSAAFVSGCFDLGLDGPPDLYRPTSASVNAARPSADSLDGGARADADDPWAVADGGVAEDAGEDDGGPDDEWGADAGDDAGDDEPDDGGADAGGASAPCDPAGPFLTPKRLSELGDDVGPSSLAADERTIYFVRGRVLFRADRPQPTGAFGVSSAVASFAGIAVGGVALSADGSTLYYAQRVDTAGSHVVHVAKRSSLLREFAPSTVTLPLSNVDDTGLAAAGNSLYYAVGRNAEGSLFRFDTKSRAIVALTDPANLVRYAAPAVPSDESVVYFFRSRPKLSPTGSASNELLFRLHPRTARSQGEAVWDGAVKAADDPTKLDAPVWVSGDGCRLYFRRDYAQASIGRGLFVTSRARQPD